LPRDTITVPSWAFHGFRNHGQRNARVLLLCAAGLGPFLREIGRPVALGAPISAEPLSQAELERVFRAAQKIPCYAYSA